MSSIGNKKIFAENLTNLMEQRGIDRMKLCSDLGLKYTTVVGWLTANTYPRIDKIEMLANYFGIQKSDLIEPGLAQLGTPYNPTYRAPVFGRISAGLPLFADEQIIGYEYIDRNDGGTYFILCVSGDSMNAARINDGDRIVVRKQEDVDDGSIAVVLVNGYDATVKRIKRENGLVMLIPQSTNPEHQVQVYDNNTDIRIIGKVVEVTFKLE